VRERKQLIRAVITEVGLTVDRQRRVAELRIVWQGGAVTEVSMPMNKPGGHLRVTDEDTIALVRRLAEHHDDRAIAAILTKQKRRTATGLPLHPRTGGDPARQPRHPRLSAANAARCRTDRRRCRRGRVDERVEAVVKALFERPDFQSALADAHERRETAATRGPDVASFIAEKEDELNAFEKLRDRES
jgi:hypothetical protein